MAILYAPSRYVPVDGSGHVYPGAKLYFYQTGTVTLQDTYSDADLAVGHKNTNPVVADSNGLFGPIYLGNNTIEYKAILKTSADVTVWTTDPLSSTVSQGGLTPYAADTGTATAYAIAPTPSVSSLTVGQAYRFLAGNTNTSSTPTLTVGSASAGVITWPNGSALSAGDIKVNAMVEVIVATATPTFHLQTYMGRWRIFDVQNPSAAATVDVTGIPATVNHVMFFFELLNSNDAVDLGLQVYGSTALIDTGANYAFGEVAGNSGATTAGGGGAAQTAVLMNRSGNTLDNSASVGVAGRGEFINIQATRYTKFTYQSVYLDSGGSLLINVAGGGWHAVAARITGYRLAPTAGTLSGKVTTYVSE